MRRKPHTFLAILAATSVLLAALLVFIGNDGKPRFLAARDGKVELERNDCYSMTGVSETLEYRQWRVWPGRYEELRRAVEVECPKSDGWIYNEQAPHLFNASKADSSLTIYFDNGDWRVRQDRSLSKLDFYRAWIRSGGKLKPKPVRGRR